MKSDPYDGTSQVNQVSKIKVSSYHVELSINMLNFHVDNEYLHG